MFGGSKRRLPEGRSEVSENANEKEAGKTETCLMIDIGSNVQAIVAVALVMFFAIFGPPVWWYRRGVKPGERREKKWGAIILGALLIISIGYIKPTVKGDWIGWAANVARLIAGAWIIAFGVKGSKAKYSL
jgi:hypothetical protein